jgi:hypothetical protein
MFNPESLQAEIPNSDKRFVGGQATITSVASGRAKKALYAKNKLRRLRSEWNPGGTQFM